METEYMVRADSSLYNQGTAQKQLFHEELNSAMNHKTIMEAFQTGRARDIGDEPKKDGQPCFIIGSGPSLDEALPLMKNWEGGVICSTSHALTLMRWGVEPDYIMCLDPFSFWHEIDGVDWSKTKTKIIAHPGVDDELIAKWPNDMLMYIQNSGRRDSFYATTQKRMYSKRVEIPGAEWMDKRDTKQFELYIRTELTIFACSPPAQMFAAGVLGYGKIFLSGVDFGYPYGKTRFTNWTKDKNGEWVEHVHPYDPKNNSTEWNDEAAIMSQNGIPTEQIHVYYKKNMISAWRLSLQEVITCDKGIITEIPYVSPAYVIKHQGGKKIKGLSEEEAIRRSERYLAKVGAFVIYTNVGMSFVESNNPLVDLPNHMMGMMKQWRCSNCGAQLTSQQDIIPGSEEEQPCPSCGKKLARAFDVDLIGNMRRIYKLLNIG